MYEPVRYREGIWELRPALFGWQYRMRPYGREWGPWRFLLGRREACRRRAQELLGPGFTLVEKEAEPQADG